VSDLLLGPHYTSTANIDVLVKASGSALLADIVRGSLTSDEAALIIATRLAARTGEHLEPLAQLVRVARKAVQDGKTGSGFRPGEAAIEQLLRALERGSLDHGASEVESALDPASGAGAFLGGLRNGPDRK
jgi:hypothetical protein